MEKNRKHEIVLFHSVLGVRQGVTEAADTFRAAGHHVYVPNLYGDGIVFDNYEKADAYVQSIGSYPELLERTHKAVADLPNDVVYAGFSNGGASAEYLSATRPGAKAALLFSAAIPLEMLFQIGGHEPEPWPSHLPVQLHYSANDPFRNQQWVDSFSETVKASGAPFDFYEYAGDGHLFTDAGLEEYDADSAQQLWARVLSFLSELAE